MSIVKSIKFNQNEATKLKEIIQDEKFSTYVKAHIFNFKKSNERLKLARETAKAYIYRANQIKKIGINLNQVAKHCNRNKTIDFLVLQKIDEILKELKRLENGS